MGKHNQKMGIVDRRDRIELKDELDSWFTDVQSKVINQLNRGYTGQIIIRINCGKIVNITNTEIIGATVLDNPLTIE